MDVTHFERTLKKELKALEQELGTVASLNSEGEWEAKETAMDTLPPMADSNEAADKIEEYEENQGIDKTLTARWQDVKDALGKVAAGTYGTCEVGGEKIEEDRLEANPAARTCKAHM